jgi:transposase InsO family protein
VSRRKFVITTVKGGNRQAPDLVERNFTAQAPDQLWVADITYIPTWAGFLYLAVVLDACSRRIVGWSMATTLATQLVLGALNMALAVRRPRGVIHHSDQGSRPCRRPQSCSIGDVSPFVLSTRCRRRAVSARVRPTQILPMRRLVTWSGRNGACGTADGPAAGASW